MVASTPPAEPGFSSGVATAETARTSRMHCTRRQRESRRARPCWRRVNGRPSVVAAAFLAIALAAWTACAGAPGGATRTRVAPGSREDDKPQFTLLYFNDLHGHLVPFTREGDTTQVGGAARMATLVRRVREDNEARGRPTLIVEGGDIFQGTPLSSVFQGEPDFKFLNSIGLDAMVLGNHEFDFGLDVLQKRISEAKFPVLAANVRWNEGGELFAQPYLLRRLSNGVRLAIFGLVTDETPETTDPVNVRDLVFEPPMLATARYMPILQNRADVIVALTHIGSQSDRKLADTFEEIDVIVGGHDQVLIQRPLLEEEVIITQAQEYGLYLGRLDLAVDGDDVELLSDTVYPITAEIPDDPEVARMVASYTKRLDRELRRTIGELKTSLEGDREAVRRRPTNFGLLLATLMKQRGRADIGAINSGAIRSSINSGPVTLGEILQALPFANRIMTVQLSGEAVQRMLAHSLAERRSDNGGGYLQLAGLSYQEGADRPTNVSVGGRPLDPSRTYTVAITDFLYRGGDGYTVFRRSGKNPRDSGALLAQVLSQHIRENSPLSVASP
jgi:5'-nucleotidase/UDP-sugar diphosphatase